MGNRIHIEKLRSKITKENKIAGFFSLQKSQISIEKEIFVYLLNKAHLSVIMKKLKAHRI